MGLIHLVPDATLDAFGLQGFVHGLHAGITPVALTIEWGAEMKGPGVVGGGGLHPPRDTGLIQGAFTEEADTDVNAVEVGATAIIWRCVGGRLACLNCARNSCCQHWELIFGHRNSSPAVHRQAGSLVGGGYSLYVEVACITSVRSSGDEDAQIFVFNSG